MLGLGRVVFYYYYFYNLPLNLYHDKYQTLMKRGSEYSERVSQGHGIIHLMFATSVYI